MPTRTTHEGLAAPGFVIDQDGVQLGQGRQVDFAALGTSAYGSAGERIVPAGTIMAIQEDGTIVPRATDPLADDGVTALEAGVILLSQADEASRSDAVTGYGVYRGGGFYRNLLPEADDADLDTYIGELGARFYFETLENDLLDEA